MRERFRFGGTVLGALASAEDDIATDLGAFDEMLTRLCTTLRA